MTVTIECKKDKQKGDNSIKVPTRPRTWRAVSEVIKKADVQVDKKANGETDAMISIIKRNNSDGNVIDNFQLFPKWTVMFQGQRVQKDLLDFLTLAQDTLLENELPIRIDYRCGTGVVTVRGKILGFIGTKGDEGLYIKDKKSHNCHIYINLDQGQSLPNTLRRFQITITGDLLPNDIYQYGFCKSSDSRFNKCSDMDYIKNNGGDLLGLWYG